MRSRLEDRNKAIELRRSGLSYKEIQEKINASKGVLSGWFKYLEFSEEEVVKIKNNSKDKQGKGRLRASITNRYKRMERENGVYAISKEKFNNFKHDDMFLVGISLYWAEGSKRTGEFQFMNSDPDMIIFMDKWMQKYLDIEKLKIKFRLFTHKIEDYEEHLPFWSNLLKVPTSHFQKTIFKPSGHKVKKNPNYKGCMRISTSGIYQLRVVKAWQKLLIEYYKI